MKKIIILTVLACAFMSTFANADVVIDSAGTTIGGVTFRPSPSVSFAANSVADSRAFDVAAKHEAGDIIYFSSNTNSRIEQDTSNALAIVGGKLSSATGYTAD